MLVAGFEPTANTAISHNNFKEVLYQQTCLSCGLLWNVAEVFSAVADKEEEASNKLCDIADDEHFISHVNHVDTCIDW